MEVILILLMLTYQGSTSQQIKFNSVAECNKYKTLFEQKSYKGMVMTVKDAIYVGECVVTKDK